MTSPLIPRSSRVERNVGGLFIDRCEQLERDGNVSFEAKHPGTDCTV
jgi:hypothetical protein